jgi:putrescine transport system permease protein
MAYGIHKIEGNLKNIMLLLVSLSFWTSFLLRIYSWMSLLSVNGALNTFLLKMGIISEPIQFIGTYYTVCLGLVFCYIPFMIFPIYAILEKVDKSYIEAAYDLGYSPTKAFWTVTIPLTKGGITTGAILVFSASIGEFVIPELLGGAETITFGRVMWNEFFSNLDWTMACALSIGMMFFIILPIYILRRKANL